MLASLRLAPRRLPQSSSRLFSSFTPSPTLTTAFQSLLSLLPHKAGTATGTAAGAEPPPVAARTLCASYNSLDPPEKIIFLTRLATTFGTDTNRFLETINQVNQDADNLALAKLAEKLTSIARPDHSFVFDKILVHEPLGMQFIVNLRADLMSALRDSPATSDSPYLKMMNSSLKSQLVAWFSAGILELRQIEWDKTSASIIELVAKKETVHPVTDLADLRNRLGNHNCFGFFHPSLPDTPLVFIHVALMPTLSRNMAEIRDTSATLVEKEREEPTAAIFYSINATQTGLAGVDLGNALIKRVAKSLSASHPSLSIFSTLSPVPGFKKWLLTKCSPPEGSKFSPSEDDIFGPHLASFNDWKLASGEPAEESQVDTLLRVLETPSWHSTPSTRLALEPILTRLVAHYLCVEKYRGKPVDGVAKFHLNNGAGLHRINFGADMTRKRMQQSFGMMVNYLYEDEETIDANHYRYMKGDVVASDGVLALL